MADIAGFLVSRAIAEAEGIPTERANQLGMIGALMGLTPMALLLVLTIACKEAPHPERRPEHPVPEAKGSSKEK
jgi:hypothetical protein